MRTIWIHIGHDKTGSSYLQSIFARNMHLLHRHGVAYPVGEASRKAAVRGMATSGTQNDETLEKRLADAPETHDVLLSYEGFFNLLSEHPKDEINRWRRWCDALGFDQIKVLLFLRDPISHASSAHMQMVRADGYYGDLDTYVASYNRPLIVWNVLNTLRKEENIDVTVHSYSRDKERLLERASGWLFPGQEVAFDTKTRTAVVNRGMTEEEYVVTSWMNRRSKKWGAKLARLAQAQRPELKGADLVASYWAQEAMIRNNQDAMAMVNNLVGVENGYQIDFREPHPAGPKPHAVVLTMFRLARAVALQMAGRIAMRLKLRRA